MKSFIHILKFIGIYTASFLLIAFIAYCLGMVRPVDDSTINYSETKVVDGESSSYEHSKTLSTSEEQMSEAGMLISLLGALVVTIIVVQILDYNMVQRYKFKIPEMLGNIEASEEKREHLTEMANKVVDKYIAHEADVFKGVASSRRSVENSTGFAAILENYPQLKANENIMLLLRQMEQCENDLMSEKRKSNEMIANYNFKIHSFPLAVLRKALKLENFDPYKKEVSDATVTEEMLQI